MRLPLLILHILGGTVGLLSGTVAMTVRKGSRLHRSVGNIFTVAMLTLASSGLYLAILKSQRGNIIGSFITFYLITTEACGAFPPVVAGMPVILAESAR